MTQGAQVTEATEAARLRAVAAAVPDPELPVIGLGDLGVLRGLRLLGAGRVEVELTPTYTGCPAVEAMAGEVRRALLAAGAAEVEVRRVLAPPWSTDDITAEGRRRLAAAGIAPPRPLGRAPVTVPLLPGPPGEEHPVRCPRCGAADTELISRFSATPCTALRRCARCAEPFDQVKER
ncbi:1,2-phenylacetyl-CoA epoxidase subunit PaaD [Streptomyces hoynatensis]|uniref:1,2-phenylacetyl-CoA epoxidase subunit PaaD n=1 Tax=Streptomyces hoynatensis TaxID=1141874 RepID=UPI001575796E|nr:1,2-phenylacetyl-CoA epoxidase subunit PaaD [Streptomyces hoynatensis]